MSTVGKSILALVGRAGALPLLVLVVGLWVTLEGFGIARAGLHLIGYQQYWTKLSQDTEPKARDFEGALRAIDAAGSIRAKNAAFPDDRAVVLLEHALRGGEPLPGVDEDVEEGIVSLERSLSLAPARAGTWTRLAIARYLKDGYTEEFAEALGMSYLLGLYEPPLLQARLELSFHAWDDLSQEMRDAAEDQIKQLWRSRSGQRSIAELFVRSGHKARFAMMRGVPQDERTLRYFFGQIRRFKEDREAAGLKVVPPEFYLPVETQETNETASPEEGAASAETGSLSDQAAETGVDESERSVLPDTGAALGADGVEGEQYTEDDRPVIEAAAELSPSEQNEEVPGGDGLLREEISRADAAETRSGFPETPFEPRPKPAL